MNWTKTELPDGRSRYEGKVNNRKVGIYDWNGKMESNGNPPKANVGYHVWDENGNNGVFRASDTVQNAMTEAERYANGQPNYRALVIVVFMIAVLIALFLLANGVGL